MDWIRRSGNGAGRRRAFGKAIGIRGCVRLAGTTTIAGSVYRISIRKNLSTSSISRIKFYLLIGIDITTAAAENFARRRRSNYRRWILAVGIAAALIRASASYRYARIICTSFMRKITFCRFMSIENSVKRRRCPE